MVPMSGESESVSEEVCSALDRLGGDVDERMAALVASRPSEDTVADQAAVFKALANEDRLRVLNALRESERCVCELQVVLDAPQSTVATHLQTLREAGLVRARKKGRWSYYRVADTAAFDLLDLAAAVGGER